MRGKCKIKKEESDRTIIRLTRERVGEEAGDVGEHELEVIGSVHVAHKLQVDVRSLQAKKLVSAEMNGNSYRNSTLSGASGKLHVVQ